MTSYKDSQIRRELIMKHYSNPKNKGEIKKSLVVEKHSQICIDNFKLFLKINNDKIEDAKFLGQGCSLFISSIDIMIDQIKNKTIVEVKDIIKNYDLIIKRKKANTNVLGKLVIYENVGKHLNRLHCVEMISSAIKQVLSSF